jgi:membrane-associated phospholipid phosphatase
MYSSPVFKLLVGLDHLIHPRVKPLNFSDHRHIIAYRMYALVLVGLCVSSILIHKGTDVLYINGAHTPWMDQFFKNITNIGEGFVFIPIFIITLFIRFQYSLACILTLVSHAIISTFCKQVIFADMLRPSRIISHDLLYFVPGVEVYGTHSFPSGHTMTAFGAAIFVALISRNSLVGFVTLIVALLVGCSRIYLAQHFLMDVAAGGLIGAFTTYVVWQLLDSAPKREWMRRRKRINRSQGKTQATS